MRSTCGRADLIRALATGGPEMLAVTAQVLGFAAAPPDREKQPDTAPPDPIIETSSPGQSHQDEAPQRTAAEFFWRLTERVSVADDDDVEPVSPPREAEVEVAWRGPRTVPESQPLASWRVLLPRLRRAIAQRAAGRDPDIPAITRALGQGRLIDRLPRKMRPRWAKRLQIIDDRSEHLVPYWRDQDRVVAWLRRLYPGHAIERARLWPGHAEPVIFDGLRPTRPYRVPPRGTAVLVLGDLGGLAKDSPTQVSVWHALGRRLRDAGCGRAALSPGPPERWPQALARLWPMLAWERPAGPVPVGAAPRAERAERLLRLVSPAIRVEPGFLRGARRLLAADAADAGTESDAWQHPAVIGTSSVAASLDPDEARRLRTDFAREPADLRRKVLALLYGWRADLPLEIWCEEISGLDPDSRTLLPDPRDLEIAESLFAQVSREFLDPDAEAAASGAHGWFRRLERRVPDAIWTDPGVGMALQCMWGVVHRDDQDAPPPPGLSLAAIPAEGRPRRRWEIRQDGDDLMLSPWSHSEGTARRLGHIDSRNERVLVTPYAPFWTSGTPPSWAEDWGWDGFGAWVTFTVGAVTQKMRWIKPGRFLMGSPEDEDERWDDEGPQHEVTLDHGFWLFDTPCPQALWSAVMATSPSLFQGAERPVEQVSWTDVQRFLGRLNQQVPGLDLSLPSEARWEYACRAGTTTALYTGDIDIIDDKAAALDPIAWYDGNSDGQTHPVKGKAPNPWGLHDMLGNVWEWCTDDWHIRYDGAPTDGTAWTASDKSGVLRVVRGGTWSDSARRVRAAVRFGFPPDHRDDFLGFRCARVHVSPASPASQAAAEPADPVNGRQAERRAEQGPPGAAAMLRLERGGEDRCPMPRSPAFRIDSDRERLSFSRLTQSDLPWAKSIGRDRFGLWAAFDVGDVSQKMRWIPPGRFVIGSPPDEPGRWNAEGPQHEVILGQGFWLFDTPCTQALWSAVMEDNPSRFPSPTRPVERVDCKRVHEFLAEINEKVSGLNLELPSEARWEYACRAGTTTALYTGDIAILGERNAPALDPIAWYGGNSGEGFDLAEGHDSKGWSEKQCPHEKAGTRPVGLKRPNAWGLYDMLGNVWEWCADDWHGSYEDAPADGAAWTASGKPGVGRVVRGGSWRLTARSVRAACRNGSPPDARNGNLGFRCARVQS